MSIDQIIPVFKPALGIEEIDAARRSLELGWLGPGSFVGEFEERIADLLNLDPSTIIAVSTGTSAIHMALVALGVGAGDEIITPSFNNIGGFQSINNLGAKPVFCDIVENDLTIDPSKLEELISNKTKAVISLDYGASLHDFNAVKKIADKHNLPILYDAAHSFGSEDINNNVIGTQSELSIFSFDPVKNITCIDGGIIVCKDPDMAKRLRHMRQLGQMQNQNMLYSNSRSFTYDVEEAGFRYHLANLHAAVGLEQIKKIPEIRKRKQLIFTRYLNSISNQKVRLPSSISSNIFPFIFVVKILENREGFIKYCRENKIDTGIHWQPGHKFTLFSECRRGDLTVTNKIGNEIVTIPLYKDLEDLDVEHIIETINAF